MGDNKKELSEKRERKNELQREYRARHKDAIKRRAKKYRIINKFKIASYQKAYFKKNRVEITKRRKASRARKRGEG